MFGISPKNGVKKHFFRPEKEHGFAPTFYSALHTTKFSHSHSRRVVVDASSSPPIDLDASHASPATRTCRPPTGWTRRAHSTRASAPSAACQWPTPCAAAQRRSGVPAPVGAARRTRRTCEIARPNGGTFSAVWVRGAECAPSHAESTLSSRAWDRTVRRGPEA